MTKYPSKDITDPENFDLGESYSVTPSAPTADILRQQQMAEISDQATAEHEAIIDATSAPIPTTRSSEITPNIPARGGVQTPESPIMDTVKSLFDTAGSIFSGTGVQPETPGSNPMGNQALADQSAYQRLLEKQSDPSMHPANPIPLQPLTSPDGLLTTPVVSSQTPAGQVVTTAKSGEHDQLIADQQRSTKEQLAAQDVIAAQNIADQEVKVQFEGEALLADQARAKIAGTYATEVKSFQTRAQADYQKARDEVEAVRAELAATPWGSYWDNKSTGDKLLLGLAVGLGAYSQSQIGGQNVALSMLNNMVSAHDKSRESHLEILKARGAAASSDSLHILDGAKKLEGLASASKLADLDQIKAQIDSIISQTNSPRLLANAQLLKSAIEDKGITARREIEDKLGARATRTENLFNTTTNSYDPYSYMTKDGTGRLVPMTEPQAKQNTVFLSQVPQEKILSKFENNTALLHDPQYVALYKALVKAPPKGFVGANIADIDQLMQLGTDIDRAALNNPAMREYATAALHFIQLQTRKESGAAMPPEEVARNMQLILAPPAIMVDNDPVAQAHALGNGRAARRTMMKTNGAAAGNYAQPKFDDTPGVQ
jgi:hypothetical protein